MGVVRGATIRSSTANGELSVKQCQRCPTGAEAEVAAGANERIFSSGPDGWKTRQRGNGKVCFRKEKAQDEVFSF